MGVTLLITFDNEPEAFYPGQIIKGKVSLTNDSEIKIKGLTITFFGDIEVYWTEAEARTDIVSPHRNQEDRQRYSHSTRHVHKEFRNQETVMCHEIVLLGQGNEEGGEEFILTRGTKVYAFQYQLPPVGLPSTFADLPYGFIRYSVEARLKRPLFRYDKVEKEFAVKEMVDVNCVPRALQPISIDKRIEFGWICCPEGSVSLDLRLQKTGYTPGERIEFAVSIVNSYRTPISQIFATLTQEIQFSTFDRKKVISSDMQYVSFQSVVEPYDVARWSDSFIIPNILPPSTLTGSRIISCHYSLKVSVKAADKVCNAACPIFIGTESFDVFRTLTIANPELVLRRLENETATASTSAWVTSTQQHLEENAKKREYDPALNPFLNSELEDSDGLTTPNGKERNIKVGNESIDDGLGLED